MPFPPLKPNYPGEMPSASGLNQLQEAMRQGGRLTGDSATGIRQGPAGLQVFDASAQPFYAKITSGAQPYAWSEVSPSAGSFVAYPEGRTGTTTLTNWPAFELNGSTTVPANTYARMRKAADGEYYWFEQLGGGGSGGGTTPFTAVSAVSVSSAVCNSDGTMTITLSVTTFNFKANPP